MASITELTCYLTPFGQRVDALRPFYVLRIRTARLAIGRSSINKFMYLYEINNAHPFPTSLDQRVFYHGTAASFNTFTRSSHGVYVTPVRSWAETHYGENIIPLYANITKQKILKPTDPQADIFYDADYKKIANFLAKLSKRGYNAVRFGGESESTVLFNDIQIKHAVTGKPM